MTRLRRHLPVLLVLCTALGATGLLWQHEQQITERRLRARFDDSLRDVASRVVQRMSTYEQMMRGVQGFHAGSADIRPQEFAAYVSSLQLGAEFAGIQGIGRISLIPTADKLRFINTMRDQGMPDYTIHPPGERPVYAPIIQVEPYAGRNLVALGFDPYSDPLRRAAMEAARDAGIPRITGKLRQILDQRPEDGPSFILYAPIFHHGAAITTLAERRAGIAGWVYAPVRLAEMMASLYGSTDPDIAFHIHDGIENTSESLLYASHPDSQFNPLLHGYEYIQVGGHSWTIEAYSLPGFAARYARSDANTIAISGICLSLLLALLTRILSTARQMAINLAQRMTEDLRSSEERWKFALEGAGDGVWDRDLSTDTVFYSRRCLEIFGYVPGEFPPVRSAWISRIHPEDRAAALADTEACINGHQESFASEYRLRCKDDTWKWVLSRGRVMHRDQNGKALRLIGTISDIDARKTIEEQIRHMAQHDQLTNLPNRALFADRLQQALSLARRDHTHLALFFVDLDEFKSVNDRFGHGIGDLLLQEVAQRLHACLRESDTAGRIGGDEFVILLPALGTMQDAWHVAEKIRSAMAEPFILDRQTIRISASIGIACHPEHGDTDTVLWTAADVAMYAAKEAGGNRVAFSETCTFPPVPATPH
ncbi:MAG: diguanylate phosphodiesterase [Proteobacteria bacterium]|nr:diguanylate phosphodiesterase [Pseudomonadota bacterium]